MALGLALMTCAVLLEGLPTRVPLQALLALVRMEKPACGRWSNLRLRIFTLFKKYKSTEQLCGPGKNGGQSQQTFEGFV